MDSVISFMDFLFPGFFILILKEYFELFLENRFSKKWIPYVFFCMYWLEDYIISNSIVLGVPYSLFFTIFNLFLLCKLIYKDSIKNILFSVFLIECLGCISEMLISIFLNVDFSLFRPLEFFVDPKNGDGRNNNPPAMRVRVDCYTKKLPFRVQ